MGSFQIQKTRPGFSKNKCYKSGKGFGVTPTSLSIKKGKAPSNRELHARLEAMQAELDALRREREASASTVYRDASDKDSINCTFQPNIPEGISHCQLYLS
ncbi:hypothetical protein KIW84_015199 [Lathyrus oleraceus]|uniref:Uncharacterized protein n=1 Tax=Pisum sativum TaxID=3888 RepID=A0A9D5BQA2_PEA|nr:hypothetical protein KIW84_015199 [Pisum sativum]